ncbi:hypothetical protein [Verrucomicrobium sp. BvORR034]|uniref:hypothetical protein n=1 Tax=Verrucomicrobium sp. BvORR034 TaxID=1396418 RepID=UPI0006784E26|nr:hypothetical protein [Verrucomicrobium sp. BvORR034]
MSPTSICYLWQFTLKGVLPDGKPITLSGHCFGATSEEASQNAEKNVKKLKPGLTLLDAKIAQKALVEPETRSFLPASQEPLLLPSPG